jgi:hypothetical protein
MNALKQKVRASPVKIATPPSTPDKRPNGDSRLPPTPKNGEAIDGKVVTERYDRETKRREAEKSEQKK